MPKKKSPNTKALNRKAGFNYELTSDIEAGLVLTGLEIKSIRLGRVNLTGSHVKIINEEAYLLGCRIDVLEGDPTRTRKLLLHKEQIKRLMGQSQEKGLSIIPVKIYLKKGRAKIIISLARGKKIHDKRESIKRKDIDREQQRSGSLRG